MTVAIFHAVNMPMGFVVLFAFSASFSSFENLVMYPVNHPWLHISIVGSIVSRGGVGIGF